MAHINGLANHDHGPARDRVHRGPGFLTLDLDDYLALLDWAGRELRVGKRGAIPADIAPILERLHVQADGWPKLWSRVPLLSSLDRQALSRE